MPESIAAARITPLAPPYEGDIDAQLRKWMPPNSGLEPLALFRTMYVHPELASRMRPLGAGILGHGLIEPRERELLILRTTARCGAEYEWGVHAAAFGSDVGLTEREIEATARLDRDAWSGRDRLLIEFADQLYESDRIDNRLWDAMAAIWSPPQLIELIVTAGWYRTISYLLGAIRIECEEWAWRFPN